MKSIKLLLTLTFLSTVIQAQVKFSDLNPEAGKTISFTYDSKGTAVEKSEVIKCTIFFFSSGSVQTKAITLTKEGSFYKAEIPTTDSTGLVALSIYADGKQDRNPNGYYVKFKQNGKIPAEAYVNEARLLDVYGQEQFGIKPNPAKALTFYNQAFALKPGLKKSLIYDYLSLNYKLNKVTGTKLINDNIARIAKINHASEKDLELVFNLYFLTKNKTAEGVAKKNLLQHYPKGSFAYGTAIQELYRIDDTQVFEDKLNKIIKNFNLDDRKAADAKRLSFPYRLLANLYERDKNDAKFEFYASKIADKLTQAYLYNEFAWRLALKNENTEFAAHISKKSLELIDLAKADELPMFYSTKEDYLKSLEATYGMYSDTYALLLYNQGKIKEAIVYQEKALALLPIPNDDIKVRYVVYLQKDSPSEKAFTETEKLIREGKAPDSIRNEFKVLYSKFGKQGGYDAYLADLDKVAALKERGEWIKKMIDEPAPAFSLTNLKGEKVELAAFKGKTVILDYWATWCGPCLASFPGMQKAVDKYKNNPDVVFLFINTRENGKDREKEVQEFIDKNKYTFNVLFDTKSVANPDEFEVISLYEVSGIPTKFVIDGKGNIRFKEIGFSGSADNLVKEVDLMIELASGVKNIAKTK